MKQFYRSMLLLLVIVQLVCLCAPAVSAQEYDLQAPEKEEIIYGYSGENRELMAYRYGSGPNVLLMCFAIHGFEDGFERDGQCLVECAQALMTYLEDCKLVDGYGWTVYILPCLNPDGLVSGYTNYGPGRCTTTYLKADGTVSSEHGIDLNRCFPTWFEPMYSSYNYTTARPMAAKEAVALDRLMQDVKGEGLNVLVDVHGWQQMTVSSSKWLRDAFYDQFRSNIQDGCDGGPGYLVRYAVELGYESVLMELPHGIKSLDAYRSSGINEKMITSLKNVLLGGTPQCGGNHVYDETVTEPRCTEAGFRGEMCTLCGLQNGQVLSALGHTPDPDRATRREPTATQPGYIKRRCTVCWDIGETTILPAYFGDVYADAYYSSALDYCYANKIAAGISADTFGVADPCTRGQVVTFLWRAMGRPEPSLKESPFLDLNQDHYYYEAVLWAAENGITTGTGEGIFSADAPCTREQVVMFLWRAMGDNAPLSGEFPFADIDAGAASRDAIQWAVEKEITSGTGEATFSPRQFCSRGQIVTFLYRALKSNGRL